VVILGTGKSVRILDAWPSGSADANRAGPRTAARLSIERWHEQIVEPCCHDVIRLGWLATATSSMQVLMPRNRERRPQQLPQEDEDGQRIHMVIILYVRPTGGIHGLPVLRKSILWRLYHRVVWWTRSTLGLHKPSQYPPTTDANALARTLLDRYSPPPNE
jgi:hypothetical protein